MLILPKNIYRKPHKTKIAFRKEYTKHKKKKRKNLSPRAEKHNKNHKVEFKPNIQIRQHLNGGAAVWL